MRIGILGGTFDPPHIGHLVIAQEALVSLHLDQVLFAPTSNPPHKPKADLTPIQDRLEMVRLAIASSPKFGLSRIDADREGPTYTVDTLRLLRRNLGQEAGVYFIMGSDSLANILTWRSPEQLIRLCRLAVFMRPGYSVNMDDLEKHLPGLRRRVDLIPAPALEVAASDLQRRVRAGLPIRHLVPDAVAAYIYDHGLYRDSRSA